MTALIQRLWAIRVPSIDRAWLASFIVVLLLTVVDVDQALASIRFALGALVSTAPYIVIAVVTIAYLKASGAEVMIAHAFKGRETRMIVLAALFGGLAPFCSCEVIPFVAGMLVLGTPVSAVMAFWLASPLIDPPSLMITASALGWHFAVAKAVAAVGVGLLGGFAVRTVVMFGGFSDAVKAQRHRGCSSCAAPLSGKPKWAFWQDDDRRDNFFSELIGNALFLLKWLALAYLLESIMIAYIPAESIASVVGGEGIVPIALSAIVGVPAYLNSYAAPPLVAGLMTQGMSAGAGMAFMIAGAVSCIPAMTAVYALVRIQVFVAYVLLGFIGAVTAGVIYGAVAATIS